jgi:hypothetical protein
MKFIRYWFFRFFVLFVFFSTFFFSLIEFFFSIFKNLSTNSKVNLKIYTLKLKNKQDKDKSIQNKTKTMTRDDYENSFTQKISKTDDKRKINTSKKINKIKIMTTQSVNSRGCKP